MDLLGGLGVLARVVETGSFSAVAREREVSQAAVARQIAQLEEHFGVRLLHRTTRKLSLTDDGQMLLGYYPFDDEGVPSQNVQLVDHGVLKTFLMSRSPLVSIPHSNGHGRRQLGFVPVARQGNLIVSSSQTQTFAAMRQKLIALVKEKGLPYGLLIDDIAGGFTFTGRGQPQAFQVTPLVVYRVFADGSPDELVRGVDIVGTPLVSLTKIVATSDKQEIFNGYCGAESGSVPVSAVAPAILISEMEFAKKETSTDRPPVLPPPAHDPEAKAQNP